MKRKGMTGTLVVLLALVLISAAVVPTASAEKISERLPSQWEIDHTIKVTHEQYLRKDFRLPYEVTLFLNKSFCGNKSLRKY